MVFKQGHLLRNYYLLIPSLATKSLWLFTEMKDKNDAPPDQLGDESFEMVEMTARFENTQNQNTTIDVCKMCRPGTDVNYATPGAEEWDLREAQVTIGAVQHYHLQDLKSIIDTSPGGGNNHQRKENWFFDIDNYNDGWVKICLVVRVH